MEKDYQGHKEIIKTHLQCMCEVHYSQKKRNGRNRKQIIARYLTIMNQFIRSLSIIIIHLKFYILYYLFKAITLLCDCIGSKMINSLLRSVPYVDTFSLHSILRRDHQKISNERLEYESVDEKSLS